GSNPHHRETFQRAASFAIAEPASRDIYTGRIHRSDRWTAEQFESSNQISVQNFNGSGNTSVTRRAETISISAPDQHCSSSQAQRFDNIATSTNTAIQKHFDLTTYASHNFR